MMAGGNHVELDWSVDGITVGVRHRRDLGDVDALAESIAEHGLLQPLTVTEEGVLVCGARRLAAIKHLGWRTVNVWVRVGLSERLLALMAERDDNTLHKDFTTTELADLYEELKTEIAADAARRVEATRFQTGHAPGAHGVGNLPTPSMTPIGDSRVQASAIVGAPYKTMEKIVTIRGYAADLDLPQVIRDQATQALRDIEAGESVDPLFIRVRSQVRIHRLEHTATDETDTPEARQAAREGLVLIRRLEATQPMTDTGLDQAARAAWDRVNATKKPQRGQTVVAPPAPSPVRLRSVKSFVWTWTEMKNWPSQYDPVAVAAGLSEEQWQQFQTTITASVEFMTTIATLRAA
jgi:ParB family chromosome partitioning protein